MEKRRKEIAAKLKKENDQRIEDENRKKKQAVLTSEVRAAFSSKIKDETEKRKEELEAKKRGMKAMETKTKEAI